MNKLDKKELMGYQSLKREIENLQIRIDRLCAKSEKIPVVTGKVKASSAVFPYTEHRVSVQMNLPEAADRVSRLMRIYEKRKDEAEERMLAIEEYISSIKEPDVRQIFQMRYIDGRKQDEIAMELHIDRSYVSKIISKYMNYERK